MENKKSWWHQNDVKK